MFSFHPFFFFINKVDDGANDCERERLNDGWGKNSLRSQMQREYFPLAMLFFNSPLPEEIPPVLIKIYNALLHEKNKNEKPSHGRAFLLHARRVFSCTLFFHLHFNHNKRRWVMWTRFITIFNFRSIDMYSTSREEACNIPHRRFIA